jgi:hypothetical protein
LTKPIVLLTAAIQCEDTPLMKRQSAELREADYMWGLKGWLETDGYDTLVFCEDTGYPLERLQSYAESLNRLKRRLVFLSCSYGKFSEGGSRGKGYGEMATIRHALDSMPELSPEQLFVKVNGRYRARNAGNVLRGLANRQEDIFCTLRGNLTQADSRFFAIKVQCARQQLLARHDQIDDDKGRFFEHILAEAVHGTILAGGKWALLPGDPLLYGFSGTFNTRFGYSPLTRIKLRFRNALAQRLY